MAALIYLDTHVVIWLYALGSESLSAAATEAISAARDVRISPVVRLELQYLYEIDRVTEPAMVVLDALQSTLNVSVCETAFDAVVKEAEGHHWTRDPFDRLIVAQASLNEAPLISKDSVLRENYRGVVW